MAGSRRYFLTPTARRNLREARNWSIKRWGKSLTLEYFEDLHNAAERIAAEYGATPIREELAGGTGLNVYPVRQHYLVFESLGNGQIIIVAVIRQGRDIPEILRKWQKLIKAEVHAFRESV